MKRIAAALWPLLLLLAIPFLLRPETEKQLPVVVDGASPDTLVIVTPHTEMIKHEFELAFRDHYRRKFGRDVVIDYRNMGGTSDITRYINDQFESAFRQYFEKNFGEWNENIAKNFSNYRLTSANPEAMAARKLFLASNVGIGLDLFFGGGNFDHARHAKQGYAIDAQVAGRHPEYFAPDVIPASFGGETLYEENGRFYGTCLSSFGLCYNFDRMKELADPTPPERWSDLGEERFYKRIVVGDPTKSGSINKCFEAILQEQLHRSCDRNGENPEALADGWRNGLNLIRRIIANSRYIADSAGKVTREVASGNAAAGMSIDFYTLTESEYNASVSASGTSVIAYVPPAGATSISSDPIQLLRGAPNRQVAEEFIDFVLSVEGQKLWNYRPGTPGGPKKYALRRPPVRMDLYTPQHALSSSDPDYNPYESGRNFVYRGDWTGPYFNLIRVLIKCTMLDVQDELQQAWGAIIAAGGPEKVPEAMEAFNREIIPYQEAAQASNLLYPGGNNTMLDVTRLRRSWNDRATANYRLARERAEAGK